MKIDPISTFFSPTLSRLAVPRTRNAHLSSLHGSGTFGHGSDISERDDGIPRERSGPLREQVRHFGPKSFHGRQLDGAIAANCLKCRCDRYKEVSAGSPARVRPARRGRGERSSHHWIEGRAASHTCGRFQRRIRGNRRFSSAIRLLARPYRMFGGLRINIAML
jgi:hypothetical protein